MDFSLFVIIWIVILIVENFVNKKKKNLPPAENNNNNFDVPTLPNNPNFPGKNLNISHVDSNQNVSEKNFQRDFNSKFENPQEIKNLNLTANSALNAVILSEIFGKPKALRRK
mgnify:CR=1 FL=1